MKKILIITLLLFPASLLSQDILDRLQPHAGLSFQYIGLKQMDGTNVLQGTPGVWYNAVSGGVNYVYAHSNDFISVGVNPNINFGLQLQDPIGLLFQAPVFITAKIGANATRYSESTVGFAVGIGGTFTYFKYPVQNLANNTSTFLESNFIAPAAMAEFTINTGLSPIIIRAHFNLNTTRTGINIGSRTEESIDLTNYGVAFLYSF